MRKKLSITHLSQESISSPLQSNTKVTGMENILLHFNSRKKFCQSILEWIFFFTVLLAWRGFLFAPSQCPTTSGSPHCILFHPWRCYLDLCMRRPYRNDKSSLPTAPSGVSNDNNKNTIHLIVIINMNN